MQKGRQFDLLFLISQLTLLNRTSTSTSNAFLKVSLDAQRSATMRDLACVYVKRQRANERLLLVTKALKFSYLNFSFFFFLRSNLISVSNRRRFRATQGQHMQISLSFCRTRHATLGAFLFSDTECVNLYSIV